MAGSRHFLALQKKWRREQDCASPVMRERYDAPPRPKLYQVWYVSYPLASVPTISAFETPRLPSQATVRSLAIPDFALFESCSKTKAERAGFEPAVPSRVQPLSRRSLSSTQPSLRKSRSILPHPPLSAKPRHHTPAREKASFTIPLDHTRIIPGRSGNRFFLSGFRDSGCLAHHFLVLGYHDTPSHHDPVDPF